MSLHAPTISERHPFYVARYVSQPDEVRPSAHGSTICELPNGGLVASWYGGTREYGLDVSIMGARLRQGAAHWEQLGVWADVPNQTMGNPVLFPEPDGRRLWLFYVVLYGEKWTSGKIHYRHSIDGGVPWGPEQTLTEELGHMTRNKVHVLPSGAPPPNPTTPSGRSASSSSPTPTAA
ncbi:MAG: exo-alpha-sialidase, partial [Chloroflexi bacterium]|nr:exo-alpha-sialidase [Chloroflexota bacterium]